MQNTRHLIRQVSDIQILDTIWNATPNIWLLVKNLDRLDIKQGDILSLKFDDPTITPILNGEFHVLNLDLLKSAIEINNPFPDSHPTNPGKIVNIVRYSTWMSIAGSDFESEIGEDELVFKIELDKENNPYFGGNFLTWNGDTSRLFASTTPDGSRRPEFQSFTEAFSGDSVMSIRPDTLGNIYVCGDFIEYNGIPCNGMVKLKSDGTIDTSFLIGTHSGTIMDMLIGPDRIFIIGYGYDEIGGSPTAGGSGGSITRLFLDGSVDTNFYYGSGSGFNGVPRVIREFKGRYYVGGEFDSYDSVNNGPIVRLTGDGIIDPLFAMESGLPIIQDGHVYDIMIYDGHVYVGGSFTTPFSGIIKLNLIDGSVSTSFMPGSGVFGGIVYSLAVWQGWIVLGGQFQYYNMQQYENLIFIDQWGSPAKIDNVPIWTNWNLFEGGTIYDVQPYRNGLLIGGAGFTPSTPSNWGNVVWLKSDETSIRFQVEELSLFEDVQFPLSYSVNDIKQPQNRKGNSSKTIPLPGNKNNNKIFGESYEIGVDSSFDPRIKKDIITLQDNLEVFTGYNKLENIQRNDWNQVDYDTKIFGGLVDLFSKLKKSDGSDLLISDLDFSEYNHLLNSETIMRSQIGQIYQNNVLIENVEIGPSASSATISRIGYDNTLRIQFVGNNPFNIGDVVRFESTQADYDFADGMHTVIATGSNYIDINDQTNWFINWPGLATITKYTSKGFGYVYPFFNMTGVLPDSQNRINSTSDDYPLHFFVKEIFDKVMDFTDTDYNSEFFGTDFFKRLIISGKKLQSDPDKADVYVNISPSEISAGTSSTYSVQTIPFNTIINDLENNWLPATYSFINYNGPQLFQFQGFIQYNIYHGQQPSGTSFHNAITRFYLYRSMLPDGSPDPSWDTGTGNNLNDDGDPMIWSSHTQYGAAYINWPDFFVPSVSNPGMKISGTRPYDNGIVSPVMLKIQSNAIRLREGEMVRFAFDVELLPSTLPFAPPGIDTGRTFTITSNSYIYSNLSTRVNLQLPDMKVKDFITSLISMTNLHFDQTNTNVLSIETYIDYYQLDDADDWTDKVDISKQAKINPLAPNLSKYYTYTYSEDNDLLNKDFKDLNNKIYGNLDYIQDSEFNSNRTETKVSFSQTPLMDIQGDPALVVPTILKEDYTEMDTFKTRISYWLGLRRRRNFYVNGDQMPLISGSSSCYGYAGHMDNPRYATLDLNFGILPRNQYYYGNGYSFNITSNTMFNRFYKQNIDEITHKDSKIVELYVKLNSYDISKLSFRKVKMIDGILYRLQDVVDYNPLSQESTLVRLLKIQTAPKWNPYPSIAPCDFNSLILVVTGGSEGAANGNYIPMGPTDDWIFYWQLNGTGNSYITLERETGIYVLQHEGGGLSEFTATPNASGCPCDLEWVWASGDPFATPPDVSCVSSSLGSSTAGSISVTTNPYVRKPFIVNNGSWNDVDRNNIDSIIFNGTRLGINEYTKNIILSGDLMNIGTGSQNLMLTGENINIGSSVSNVSVIGSNVEVLTGVTNSIVFGSNIIATESNTIYIGATGQTVQIGGSATGSSVVPGLQEVLDTDNSVDNFIVDIPFTNVKSIAIGMEAYIPPNSQSVLLGGPVGFSGGTYSNANVNQIGVENSGSYQTNGALMTNSIGNEVHPLINSDGNVKINILGNYLNYQLTSTISFIDHYLNVVGSDNDVNFNNIIQDNPSGLTSSFNILGNKNLINLENGSLGPIYICGDFNKINENNFLPGIFHASHILGNWNSIQENLNSDLFAVVGSNLIGSTNNLRLIGFSNVIGQTNNINDIYESNILGCFNTCNATSSLFQSNIIGSYNSNLRGNIIGYHNNGSSLISRVDIFGNNNDIEGNNLPNIHIGHNGTQSKVGSSVTLGGPTMSVFFYNNAPTLTSIHVGIDSTSIQGTQNGGIITFTTAASGMPQDGDQLFIMNFFTTPTANPVVVTPGYERDVRERDPAELFRSLTADVINSTQTALYVGQATLLANTSYKIHYVNNPF